MRSRQAFGRVPFPGTIAPRTHLFSPSGTVAWGRLRPRTCLDCSML